MRPKLAIVVAATESIEAVHRCVASIAIGAHDRLFIAYDPSRIDGTQLPLGVIGIAGEPGANAHRLRFLGLSRSDEPIVVFTEDSCLVSKRWLEAWREAFQEESVWAATGSVEPGTGGTVVDQAVFLCEYAPFCGSIRRVIEDRYSGATDLTRLVAAEWSAAHVSKPDTVTRLAGNNFAIRRGIFSSAHHDIHESEVARQVRDLGGKSILIPDAIVHHYRHYSWNEAIRDRSRFGFEFGRLSAASSAKPQRLARILFGPGILASQVVRLGWTLARKRRGFAMLLKSGPFTLLLLTAWSLAEWLGWIVGPSRRSNETAAHMPSQESGRISI